MNTFEKCQSIRRLLLNRAAEVMTYKNWSEDFAAKQIRDFPEEVKMMTDGDELFGIQPAELTEAEMMDLGFGKWRKKTPTRLIPLWLFPFLADELETECIDGEKKTLKKSDMDTDNRFGCLTYGVVPSIETVHIIIHNRSYPVEAYLDEGGAYKRYAELQDMGVVSLKTKEKKEGKP